jgi:hypothetical protein
LAAVALLSHMLAISWLSFDQTLFALGMADAKTLFHCVTHVIFQAGGRQVNAIAANGKYPRPNGF